MNSLTRPRTLRLAFLIVLTSTTFAQVSDSYRRQEQADIQKLAAITKEDHSTIFFHGLTEGGYVRNGEFHSVPAFCKWPQQASECAGPVVSHDGSRIAYGTAPKGTEKFTLLLRDLATDQDRKLGEFSGRGRNLSWSWDNTEIAYQGSDSISAISVSDRKQRTLAPMPLRVNGKTPTEGWIIYSIDWLHQRPELILDVEICVPTRQEGTCVTGNDTILYSSDGGRLLIREEEVQQYRQQKTSLHIVQRTEFN